MPEPDHLAYLRAAFADAEAAPLSARRARLVALLADAHAERLFTATGQGGDRLAHRAALAARFPALDLVFGLAAGRPAGPTLVIEAVAVPIAEYGALGLEDFMVSLYNDHTVQRVRIALPDGSRRDAHAVLAEAIAALETVAREGAARA